MKKSRLVFLCVASAALFLFVSIFAGGSLQALRVLADFARELEFRIPHVPFVQASEVEEREVFIPHPSGDIPATLYLPAHLSKRVPAAVFAYGVVPNSKDPRIAKLSTSLAGVGMAILVPAFPELFSEEVKEQTADDMVAAFNYLRGLPFVEQEKVGFIGFCVGGSLALIAAADASISRDVAYVHVLSPYYDIVSLGESVFSKTQIKEGILEVWRPSVLTQEIYRSELVSLLGDEEEKEYFSALSLERDVNIPDDVRAGFSSDGKALAALFAGEVAYGTGEDFAAGLSEDFRQAARARSPSAFIEGVKARVFIIAGYDEFIPFTESEKLKDAFGEKASLVRFEIFSHVSSNRAVSNMRKFWDVVRLWNHLRMFFTEAL